MWLQIGDSHDFTPVTFSYLLEQLTEFRESITYIIVYYIIEDRIKDTHE